MTAHGVPGVRARPGRRARSESRFALLLMAPTLLVAVGVVVVPLVTVIGLSFTSSSFIGDSGRIGFQNFVYLATIDPYFWRTIRNTIVWAVGIVAAEFVIGLAIASLLNRPIRFRGLFRALVLLPWVVPSVTAALVWLTLYADDGVLNQMLEALGLPAQAWLTNPSIALLSLMIVSIWKTSPFMIVALLAGLQTIPEEYYDAAQLDGANAMQRFARITFPILWPISSLMIVLSLIWRAGDFDLINLLTGGGPANTTQVIATYAYQQTVQGLQAGRGAAIALVGLVLLTALMPYFVRTLVRQTQ